MHNRVQTADSLVVPHVPHEIGAVEQEVRHGQHHDDLVGEGVQPRKPPESHDDENRGQRRDQGYRKLCFKSREARGVYRVRRAAGGMNWFRRQDCQEDRRMVLVRAIVYPEGCRWGGVEVFLR